MKKLQVLISDFRFKLPRLASRATPSKFEGDLLSSHHLITSSSHHLIIFLLFAFCFLPSALFAQKQERIDSQSKEFTKSYDVKPQDLLVLNSSYAKVTFEEWDKNKVEFVATITLEKVTEKDMENVLKGIDITANQVGRKITYNLSYNNSSFKSPRYKVWSFEISLVVKIPKDIYLEIESSYGNVNITNVHNDFTSEIMYANLTVENFYGNKNTITNKYGNTHIENLAGNNNTIDVQYGNLKINHAHSLSLNLSYGKGNFKECGTVKLSSKYSTIKMNKINTLKLSSEGDIISIQNSADKIEGKMKYGNLTVNSLINSCVFTNFAYSNITIDEVLPSFTNISFLSSYSNIKFNIPQEQSFNFDYSGKYTDFKDKSIKLNDATFEAGSNSVLMTGFYGSQRNSGKTVKIEASFGSVSLFGK